MNDTQAKGQASHLVLEYELEAPPERVWRAITIPAFRERWLPEGELADTEPVSTKPGEEIRYRMREDTPPFLESIVTFQIMPDANGGTVLRIVHGLEHARPASKTAPAANSNEPWLMCAA